MDLVLLNDAAGDAFAGIPRRLLRFEIVRVGVNDHSVADDRVGSIQSRGVINLGDLCHARSVGDEVAEVAHVTLDLIGRGMGHSGRIIVSSGRRAVGRGTIALVVNVKAMPAGLEAGDFAIDAHTVSGAAEIESSLGDVTLRRAQNYNALSRLLSDGRAATECGGNKNGDCCEVGSPFHMSMFFPYAAGMCDCSGLNCQGCDEAFGYRYLWRPEHSVARGRTPYLELARSVAIVTQREKYDPTAEIGRLPPLFAQTEPAHGQAPQPGDIPDAAGGEKT